MDRPGRKKIVALGALLALLCLGLLGRRPASVERAEPAPRGELAADPAPRVVVAPAVAKGPGTTIVVLHLAKGRLDLVSFADKPALRFAREPGSAAPLCRYDLEDAESGKLLDTGTCELPAPCACALGHDHADGCAMVRHETVVRLKVARLARHERLRIVQGTRELGTFALEERS
jgi:hypothetical protein